MGVRTPSSISISEVADYDRQLERMLAASRATRIPQQPMRGAQEGQAPHGATHPQERELPIKSPPPGRLQTPIQPGASSARILHDGTTGHLAYGWLGRAIDVYLNQLPGDASPGVREQSQAICQLMPRYTNHEILFNDAYPPMAAGCI